MSTLSLGDTNAMWYSDNHHSAMLKYLLLFMKYDCLKDCENNLSRRETF